MTTAMQFDARAIQRASYALFAGGAVYAVSPVHPPVPCPLRSLTGIPCPLCGMTRAVTTAFRFDILGSLRFNPGGIALIAFAIWAMIALRRRTSFRLPAWIPIAGITALWAWNIVVNPTFN